jgi:hypothetical protein
VWNWEIERKEQIKRVKSICHYPPTFSTKRRFYNSRKKRGGGIDMVARYASAGPNKQMYEMYNMSMRAPENVYQTELQTSQTPLGYSEIEVKEVPEET